MLIKLLKRAFLVGLVTVLLLGVFPAGPATVEAANNFGPQLAAYLASDLIGVNHRYGGSSPQEGMDNCGLVHYVYRRLGMEMPRSVAAQAQVGQAVSKNDLEPGDLVFFSSPSSSKVSHVGIYLDQGDFVASSSSTNGVARRNLGQAYYQTHFVGARRVSTSAFAPLYQAVAQATQEMVGVPYAAGGSSANGVDNVGLIRYVYGQFYLAVPRTLAELATTGVAVSRQNLRPGDMVFFRGATLPQPFRVGLYIGDNRFAIVDSGFGQVVVRDLRDSWYSARYLEARRPWADFQPPASYAAGGSGQPSQEPQPAPQPQPEPQIVDRLRAEALRHLGKPYKLGATGPNVFDCSGFVRYVFGQVGISLPRSSTSQSQAGTAVSRDQLKPGDLVFFKNTWRNNGQIDHVAVYLGDGQIVHAITSGVRTNRLSGYWLDHYASARRVLK